MGQGISAAEYFFNADPGVGSGTAIPIIATPDSISFNATVSTTGLDNGYHLLYVRTRDDQGRWSLHAPRRIEVHDLNMAEAEYFFNTDPGVGSGTAITVATTPDSVALNATVNTTGLANGYHLLYVRTRDDQGRWSLHAPRRIEVRDLNMAGAEYFFDTDPGVGNGTAITVSTSPDSVAFNATINTTGLANEYHLLYLRTRDDRGKWSLHAPRRIEVRDLNMAGAEYFFDTDPGVGNGTAIAVANTTDSVAFNATVNTVGLSSGFHMLYVRTRDDRGKWSLQAPRRMNISSSIVAAEIFFDTDPGIGNGNALTPGVASDSVSWTLTATIPALSLGDHNMYVRTKDDHGVWGHYSLLQLITVITGPNVWTGNSSQLWNVTLNWSNATVPSGTDNALVPTTPIGGNFPTVNILTASVNDIEIETGATLTVTSGNALTVEGALTNDGTVYVNNAGSLVQTTGSDLFGSGQFQLQRVGSSVYDYWSSPISSATPNFLGTTVYQFDPSTGTADHGDDAFDPGWVAPGATMTPGKGFAAYGAGTKTFIGIVNNGPVDIGVTAHPLPNVSYNLIGNPYPCGVDVNTFLTANSALLATGAIYLWDDPGTNTYVTGDYATRNGTGGTAGGGGHTPTHIIGTAQGFKVQVNGNGNINFTNAMRTTGNSPMLFRQSQNQRLWLSALSAGNRFNQTLIGFMEDGTDGVDWLYDAPKLNPVGQLSLYSSLNDEPYAIQGFGPLGAGRVVPLGLHSYFQTIVTIALDSTDNLNGQDIVLEDRHLNIFHDLRASDYTFMSEQAHYSDRFFLHVSSELVTAVEEGPTVQRMQGWTYQGILTVVMDGALAKTATIQILDLMGRQICERAVTEPRTQLDMRAMSHGIYIVRMINGADSCQLKVMN
ncbi:MAG: hypothetical protein K9J06_02785 [Flavobacteriales bacterium]|nr:hypothetical protein [Flavobacteriales bacterium]